MSEPIWDGEERSGVLSSNLMFSDLFLNWSSMSHQAWTIADLPHRRWKLKYLPDEFRAEDTRDENHPYYSLLQTFDQLRDLQFTTDDIPVLTCLEPKLLQIGKIIDKLIDLPGPYAKGIFDFTALSAYVHTINDLWSKKNQMFLTPIWRQPWEYRHPSQHYSESLVYDPILFSQLSQINLILDWWLGKPQFDFWIGIIDLNFDSFQTQLEAYVHWYNAVFFPAIKEKNNVNNEYNEMGKNEKESDTKMTDEEKKKTNKEIYEINDNSEGEEEVEGEGMEEEYSGSESEEEIDIEGIGNKEKTPSTKKIYMLKVIEDDLSECDWSSSSDY